MCLVHWIVLNMKVFVGKFGQILKYSLGIPGQFQIPTANHAPMYMPHMPGGVTSSPQHQPQIYQQNLNHPAIPTMQVRNKHHLNSSL